MSARLDAVAPSAASPRFSIRPLREGDLPRVLEIERASFSTPWSAGTFRSLMKRADTDLFAAEADGKLLGYAVVWTVADQSELGNVAVHADARGQGVGGALVDAVLERVGARGAAECFLEVRESNGGAQAIYRRRGFEVVGRRRAYYASPTEDALVMRRPVGEAPLDGGRSGA
jgi:[ribosomal protein S18]-alanine N-acetyltransferase